MEIRRGAMENMHKEDQCHLTLKIIKRKDIKRWDKKKAQAF